MKTEQQWQDSKLSLEKFLQVGDFVDETMYYYFLEVLWPACMSSVCVQIGEPYDHDEKDRPRFMTIEKIGGNWIYTGVKVTPADQECMYRQ